jgi:nitrite reductase/ring-hydroxylating ferredoxin subunit/uncharacterized membrane protein
MTHTARSPAVHEVLDTLERREDLDGLAKPIGKLVRDTVPAGTVKDLLSGVPLGHALHPILTDVPVGTWTSALLLDWTGGREAARAADRLIALGLLASVPTVATGLTEWADSEVGDAGVRRVGLVHAAANAGATVLFAASLVARRRRARGAGKLLALAGGALLGVGGQLGGHLTLAQGVGVDQTTFEAPPDEWTPVLRDAELPEGEARYAEVGGIGVLLARVGGELHALSNRCTHRGGPLDEGEIADGCVTCPWHSSRFRLSDGSVEQGPAAYPQPVWDVRSSDGVIEVRPPARP